MSGSAAALANVIRNVPLGLRAPGAVVGRGPEAVVQSYVRTVLGLAPIAYWRMGEASGNAVDASGNGHTGTTSGGITYGVPGALANDSDTAVTLDGTTGTFTIPDDPAFDVSSFTICGWFKTANAGSVRRRIWSQQNGAVYYVLALNANQVEELNSIEGTSVITTNTYNDSQWHFAVGARQNGVATTVYVDGAAAATASIGSGSLAIAANPQIGALTGTEFFGGSLDEIAVFNYALNAAQVAQLWHAGVGK